MKQSFFINQKLDINHLSTNRNRGKNKKTPQPADASFPPVSSLMLKREMQFYAVKLRRSLFRLR